MKSGLLFSLVTALVAFSALPAQATCITRGSGFYPGQNDEVTMIATVTGNGVCGGSYGSGGLVFTGLEVVTNPVNGTIQTNGITRFLYRANPGFKGKDTFVLKVCASGRGGEGCSTITYKLEIE